MSDQKEAFGTPPERLSAEKLRMRMAEKELEEARKAVEKRSKLEAEQKEFRDYFMDSEVTDKDRERIRQKALRLADQGQTELCVLSFPASFCSDGGRAINNNLPDWQKTLTGRAEKMFALWETNAKPLGYKLEARVLNYPKGMIGDIGLFVLW